MRNILQNLKTPWPQSDKLDWPDWSINKMVYQLDDIAAAYEAVWGVGKPDSLVSSQTKQKWELQKTRLVDAANKKDENTFRLIVEGCIRGYKAMNDEAINLGHKPLPIDYWEARHESGQVYRICKNNIDAVAAKQQMDKNVIVMSLSEVINFYHAAREKTYNLPAQ